MTRDEIRAKAEELKGAGAFIQIFYGDKHPELEAPYMIIALFPEGGTEKARVYMDIGGDIVVMPAKAFAYWYWGLANLMPAVSKKFLKMLATEDPDRMVDSFVDYLNFIANGGRF